MKSSIGSNDAPVWLGQDGGGRHEAFADGKLWIGQHSGDQDVLVFDPAESDPTADVLSLYSLTEHRMRRFPRATVLERISPLTDEVAHARAKKDYARRASLQASLEEELTAARSVTRDQQREGVISAHRQYIENLGLTYEGVKEPAAKRSGRQLKCHACGILLDDFTGVHCGLCSGMLCSCGACACGKAAKRT